MYKKNKCYWMYSKYAIENALLNPERNILEMLVEEKFSNFYKTFFAWKSEVFALKVDL